MNEFKNAKEEYDNTPIPAELSERVQAGIQEGKARYRARRGRTIRRWASAAASSYTPGTSTTWAP